MNWQSELDIITSYYKGKKANRSGRSYISHILEGILILDFIKSTSLAKAAFCLHPIVQNDRDLKIAFQIGGPLSRGIYDHQALLFAMEYRNIANQYNSKDFEDRIIYLRLSPLEEVNQMLVADKIQNYKDYYLYVRDKSSWQDRERLDKYFKNWFIILGISAAEVLLLCGKFFDWEKFHHK